MSQAYVYIKFYSYVCRYVAGFVSKSDAKNCLQSASIGTFLCRFSDTKLGGVSIVDRRRQNCKYT